MIKNRIFHWTLNMGPKADVSGIAAVSQHFFYGKVVFIYFAILSFLFLFVTCLHFQAPHWLQYKTGRAESSHQNIVLIIVINNKLRFCENVLSWSRVCSNKIIPRQAWTCNEILKMLFVTKYSVKSIISYCIVGWISYLTYLEKIRKTKEQQR